MSEPRQHPSGFKPTYVWPNALFPFREYLRHKAVRIFIIENIQHNWNWLSEWHEGIRETDYFFVYCGWYYNQHFARQAESIFEVLKLKKSNFFIMFNSPREMENFKPYGFEGDVINHNAWLDENLVMRPLRDVRKIYDAVYVARRSAFKRHMLAKEVKKLALIAGNNHGNGISEIPAYPAYMNPAPLCSAEVCQKINESHVGLILSETEGACFASSEYLLCGVPVVSTPCFGGRDVWYNEVNSIVCQPDADSVARAVEELKARAPDPGMIRQMHIDQAKIFRGRFANQLAKIFKKYGVDDVDAQEYFEKNFYHKMRKSIRPDFKEIFGDRVVISKDRKTRILVHDADWQHPAITEQHAFHRVRDTLPEVGRVVYLAFPWATLFDLLNKSHPRAGELLSKLEGLASELRDACPAIVASVCQHVDLPKHVGVVAGAGITDVFWSHATKGVRTLAEGGGVSLHPFPLYPVHVAQEVSPEAARPFLFSFAGAIENPCYLSEARLWIWEHLRDHPKGRVVARGMWHYHGVVYEAQIQGRALGEEKGQLEKEEEFRDLLARSLFVLCPSGSGPNSIRLWEALASGAIPVLISDTYLPPGDLREWEEAVVFCDETRDAIAALPSQLEAIAADPQRLARMREGCRRLARKFGPENFGSCIFEWARSRSSSRRVLSGNREFGLGDLAKRILADGTANARRASVFLACVDSQLMLEGRAFLKTLEAEGELRAAVQQALKSCSEKERAFHGRAMEFARQRG